MVKKIFFLILLLFLNFALATSGFEAAKDKIVRIISNIINFLFAILLVFASIALIWLAILVIVLGKQQIKFLNTSVDIRQAIIYVVLGIVFLILSFFFPNIIKDFVQESTKK